MKRYVATRPQMTDEDWRTLGWSEEELSRLTSLGQRRTGVQVIEIDGENITMKPLEHIVRHSPDGFEWGYGGSGPAELARCILIDLLGEEAKCSQCLGTTTVTYEDGEDMGTERCWNCDDGFVLPVSYQDFKFEMIASQPTQGFMLREEEIRSWVRGKLASG